MKSFKKKKLIPIPLIIIAIIISNLLLPSIAQNASQLPGYVVENDKDIAKQQPGPHDGAGLTLAHSFFEKEKDLNIIFRKRILYPGSSIGYHLQEGNEIYYIVKGRGEMQMNGKSFPVSTGDCIFTRPGNSHGLTASLKDTVTVIINYLRP